MGWYGVQVVYVWPALNWPNLPMSHMDIMEGKKSDDIWGLKTEALDGKKAPKLLDGVKIKQEN